MKNLKNGFLLKLNRRRVSSCRQKMFERRMAYLTSRFQQTVDTPLQKHFSIPGKYTWTPLSFATFQLDMERKLDVIFPLSLPDDVCNVISSYLHTHVHASLLVTYTSAFTSPKWSILYFNSNLFVNLHSVIAIHNRRYEHEWSPAVTIEMDILHVLLEILPLFRNGRIKN